MLSIFKRHSVLRNRVYLIYKCFTYLEGLGLVCYLTCRSPWCTFKIKARSDLWLLHAYTSTWCHRGNAQLWNNKCRAWFDIFGGRGVSAEAHADHERMNTKIKLKNYLIPKFALTLHCEVLAQLSFLFFGIIFYVLLFFLNSIEEFPWWLNAIYEKKSYQISNGFISSSSWVL